MRAKTGAFGPVVIGLDAGLGFGAFAMFDGELEFVRRNDCDLKSCAFTALYKLVTNACLINSATLVITWCPPFGNAFELLNVDPI